jgi:hypothetical protein
MEKAKSRKKKEAISRESLQELFMEYFLTHGQTPASVYAFTKANKMTDEDFYSLYNSFAALESDIWKKWALEVIDAIESDESYGSYSVSEKLLSFYFTWFAALKQNRSYVLAKFENLNRKEMDPPFLMRLKFVFKEYIQDLMIEGKDTMEVADRPFNKIYDQAFWFQLMFLIRMWVEDLTDNFDRTDAAIEKSVNFSFDLIARGPYDSFVDLAKFLFQNKGMY